MKQKIERNTLTTFDKLSPGDRFHKAGDSKKVMFTKMELDSAKADGEPFPKGFKHDKQVVYLRSLKRVAL